MQKKKIKNSCPHEEEILTLFWKKLFILYRDPHNTLKMEAVILPETLIFK